MTASVNALWQGYLLAIEWIATRPHKTFWLGLAAVVAAAIL